MKAAYARWISAAQDQSLLAIHDANETIIASIELAPEHRNQGARTPIQGNVKAGGIDSALPELLQCMETPHEGHLQRYAPRAGRRVAQRASARSWLAAMLRRHPAGR